MKLRIRMVDFWGTSEMDRSLTIQGISDGLIVYPVNGMQGPKGVTGHSGSIGVAGISAQLSHGYSSNKKYVGNLRFGKVIPGELNTRMTFDIPEVIYIMGSDVQFHFDLEFSEYKDHDLVLYVVNNDVNVLFENSRLQKSIRELGYTDSISWRSESRFFDYSKTGVKADSTVPELHKKEPLDANAIYNAASTHVFGNATISSHNNAHDLMVPHDDIYRQMILDDVEKYVVQSLSTTLSNLPGEMEVIERFPEIPFEYWKLLFHIHHCSYTRDLVKEHISHKYRALCTIAQYMEDSYASTIRDDARL